MKPACASAPTTSTVDATPVATSPSATWNANGIAQHCCRMSSAGTPLVPSFAPSSAPGRAETESARLYEIVAAHEEDPRKAKAFRALGVAAEKQAAILAGDLGETPRFSASLRARVVAAIVRWRGPERSKHMLAAMKV